jgi:glycosyltransferase involved in cell wall biosynthesis
VRQQLLHEYGFREDQVSTIYNGVDPHIQQRAAASPRIPSPPAIYAIGRLTYQKGFDRLIAAFALCSQQRPDLQLHIFGEGELREPLQHQIDQLGLTHAITLHGFKRDIAQIYPQIPVLAMSSHFEGLPLVLTEAITFGVPVVAFDCDFGPAEIIVEGVNGYLVPQDDIPALAQALLRALETEWDTEQIKATARRFAPDTMVQAKLALIQRLCLSKQYRP